MFGLFKKADEHVRPDGERGFLLQVRTSRHGDVVQLRLNKGNEIGSSDEGGYYVRKAIVSSQNLDRATLEIWFDNAYRPKRKVVEGGELIPIKEWV